MSKAEYREWYRFPTEAKKSQKANQSGQCALTPSSLNLEAHHLLPAAVARDKYAQLPTGVFSSQDNMIYLSKEVHRRVHASIEAMPDNLKNLYFEAIVKHLLEKNPILL